MKIETASAQVWEALQAEAAQMRQIPTATYRLQFNHTFTFRDAIAQLPYLKALGISHIYASPYFGARPESMHGYDISDHNKLNPSIGAMEDYEAMVQALHEHGMGQILDTVPNHMGINDSGNSYWMDVLENGPSSPYATFFDIDWQPLKQEMANQVLLPILGDQYGRVLEKQELRLNYDKGAFFLCYYEKMLPVAPGTYAQILQLVLEILMQISAPEDEHVLELQSILTALEHLPTRTETDPQRIAERHREKEIIKRRINALTESYPAVVSALDATLHTFNGVPGDARSFDRLDELVRSQAYRLAYWRVAAEEINYRRFFDINDLAAIRMEQPAVFEATHRLILWLLSQGHVNGLRIDHPDGLWDPAGYFRNLQRYYLLALAQRLFTPDEAADEQQWPLLKQELLDLYEQQRQADPHSLMARPLYVVVEKILGERETLPPEWTVDGTSGYEFLNLVNGLFVESANAKTFESIYSTFIRQRTNFNDLVLSKKKQIMLISLVSEINVLAHQLNRIAERNRYVRDFTLNSLTYALREVIASFPIYRTYIADSSVPERAQPYIEAAIKSAKRRNPVTDPSIFDFIRDVLLLKYPGTADEEDRRIQQDWVQKFQQVTGPVMAKGLEDTAFYIYNRLISLNEVGGEPQRFGVSVAEFHRANQERAKNWAHTMLTTSTHDTKRSEDVRARINVLSEFPREWKSALTRWSRLNRRHKTKVEGREAPDRNEEYLLYQTLLGSWPSDGGETPWTAESHASYVERIQNYMQKALKEAKVNTSWVNPNEDWDAAVRTFVERVLESSPRNAFLPDFHEFARRITRPGAYNALAQTLLKLTAPGVPDIYQGNESWDLSLVDPDNRRPVDYAGHARLLHELSERREREGAAALARALLDDPATSSAKLYLTTQTLTFRRAHDDLFRDGGYAPLEAVGPHSAQIVAFARRLNGQEAIIVTPRLFGGLARNGATPVGELWADDLLLLPDATIGTSYTQLFTDARVEVIRHNGRTGISLAEIFADFPVAVLINV
jgi:(1->4)-alpha-D-glucan 1-alpha-D-glucosylmutase